MTGVTHRQYSILFAYMTIMLFFKMDITCVNYYLAIPVIIMSSKCGALFPDVDHTWQNVHDKTMLNKIINTLIHLTGGKHRSWQTHSIDICLYFTTGAYLIPRLLYSIGKISQVDKELLTLLLLGFASGWLSHLFSDMLTSAGVRLIFFVNFKVKFVPKKIGNFRFNTGHEWEKFNCKVIKVMNRVAAIICIVYPFIAQGELIELLHLMQK